MRKATYTPMDLKSALRIIVDFVMEDTRTEILPLTTPVKEVQIESSKPRHPDFYSNHGAKAPYLYNK